jgi:hypothetical protein
LILFSFLISSSIFTIFIFSSSIKNLIYFNYFKIIEYLKIFIFETIMGNGDWGLGIGDWGLGPIPNPQSPIPNPQSPFPIKTFNNKKIYYFILI